VCVLLWGRRKRGSWWGWGGEVRIEKGGRGEGIPMPSAKNLTNFRRWEKREGARAWLSFAGDGKWEEKNEKGLLFFHDQKKKKKKKGGGEGGGIEKKTRWKREGDS